MAYNKGKAEFIWRRWKKAEEKQLRKAGVDEETISELREYDWSIFKSDRRFYEKVLYEESCPEGRTDGDLLSEIRTTEQFLDSVENEALYKVLATTNPLTLQIVFMKTQGYSGREIALHLGISKNAVYGRMFCLRRKIKKVLQ